MDHLVFLSIAIDHVLISLSPNMKILFILYTVDTTDYIKLVNMATKHAMAQNS